MASEIGAFWSVPSIWKSPHSLALTCSRRRATAWLWLIRSRVAFPFLDYRVVEFCGGLPQKIEAACAARQVPVAKSWLATSCRRTSAAVQRNRTARQSTAASSITRSGHTCENCCRRRPLREAGLFHIGAVTKLVAKIDQGQTLSETDDMALAGVLSSQLLHSTVS